MKYDRRKDISPKYLLLAMTVICIGLILMSYFAGDKAAGVKRYTMKFVTPIQKGINQFGLWTDSKVKNLETINELQKENERLEKELQEAKLKINSYQNQLTELASLQQLYQLDTLYPDYNKTAAHVFAKDAGSWFSVFYIDKGTKDGIFEGANVLCGEGLTGIVTECYDDYAKVRAIIDDTSYVSCRILPSNALCTVEGNLSQFEDGYLLVKNIDIDAIVTVGDRVVTSTISDRYHPGLDLGFISDIRNDSNNLTMTAYITPSVDFTNVTEVLIILNPKKHIND